MKIRAIIAFSLITCLSAHLQGQVRTAAELTSAVTPFLKNGDVNGFLTNLQNGTFDGMNVFTLDTTAAQRSSTNKGYLSKAFNILRNTQYDIDRPYDNKYKKALEVAELFYNECRKTPPYHVINLFSRIENAVQNYVNQRNELVAKKSASTPSDNQQPSNAPHLFLINSSTMNLEYASSDIPTGMLPPGTRVPFPRTPKTLSIRVVKDNNSKGPWYPLAAHLLSLASKKGSRNVPGDVIIYNSTKLNPLGWNIGTQLTQQ